MRIRSHVLTGLLGPSVVGDGDKGFVIDVTGIDKPTNVVERPL